MASGNVTKGKVDDILCWKLIFCETLQWIFKSLPVHHVFRFYFCVSKVRQSLNQKMNLLFVYFCASWFSRMPTGRPASAMAGIGSRDDKQAQKDPKCIKESGSWFSKTLIGRTPSLPSTFGKKKHAFFKVGTFTFSADWIKALQILAKGGTDSKLEAEANHKVFVPKLKR